MLNRFARAIHKGHPAKATAKRDNLDEYSADDDRDAKFRKVAYRHQVPPPVIFPAAAAARVRCPELLLALTLRILQRP